MYDNLRKFIDVLGREGELIRVRVPVDPVLEIAEITDRMSKSPGGGKAILFENTGTEFPVLTNMFGSVKRMSLALGVKDLDEIPRRIDFMLGAAASPKESFMDKLRLLPLMNEAARWFPKKLKGVGDCQQYVHRADKVDLGSLPILKCWPFDAGRFVTLPIVVTEDPVTGIRNAGMYRMQVTGRDTTGMHWHVHKTGERHYREYKRLGLPMPVSVCLGGDPAYTYAATAPLPDNIDEWLLAGFLRGKPVRMVKCVTNDLYVPSDCDFVIEGYVDTPKDKFIEGPFGDHTGFYSLEDLYPEFRVTAVTHREDAVWPATIVGIPPQEDAYIALATEKIFLSPIRFAIQPEVKDLYMPVAGVSHNLALVSIDKTYPGQAFKTASSMWGAGQMMFNKFMIVTGEGTDIRNGADVLEKIRNADPDKDVMVSRGVYDVLDHSTSTTGEGGKAVLDLTVGRDRKEPAFRQEDNLPGWCTGINTGLLEHAGIMVVYAGPEEEVRPEDIKTLGTFEQINIVVLADTKARTLGWEELLWLAAGNTEPGRDCKLISGMIFIDARTKYPPRPGYPVRMPNIVTSSEETKELVDRRWDEYGIGPRIDSPSARYEDLVYPGGAAVESL